MQSGIPPKDGDGWYEVSNPFTALLKGGSELESMRQFIRNKYDIDIPPISNSFPRQSAEQNNSE
jgi:hypothetical protein